MGKSNTNNTSESNTGGRWGNMWPAHSDCTATCAHSPGRVSGREGLPVNTAVALVAVEEDWDWGAAVVVVMAMEPAGGEATEPALRQHYKLAPRVLCKRGAPHLTLTRSQAATGTRTTSWTSEPSRHSDKNKCNLSLCWCLTPSLLGRVFLYILLTICQFYTVSDTRVGIKIVQTPAINLLTSIDPSECQ